MSFFVAELRILYYNGAVRGKLACGHARKKENVYLYGDRPMCRTCRGVNEANRRARIGVPIYRSKKAWYAANRGRLCALACANYIKNRERVLAFKRIALIARKEEPTEGEMAQLLELRARYPKNV